MFIFPSHLTGAFTLPCKRSNRKLHLIQCRIKGGARVLRHPGPQFWGPQLVGVVSWLQVCKGPALGTAPGPALALMRPWSYHFNAASCFASKQKKHKSTFKLSPRHLRSQNDRPYAPNWTEKVNIASCHLFTTFSTFTKSVTVSVAESKLGAVLHQVRSKSQWTVLPKYLT